ncbi:type II toxin-antitoxin system death-on-curing family toxin [Candidatus Daviesbacteria bacterium]|nr:type II toxin-antitoxin system death-on-curing family toxin [Candidatus Daviesbacteria bacterium]
MARFSRPLINYLSEGEVIAINSKMVAKYGGLHGVKDVNLLSLAIGRPQMSVGFQDAYKTIFDKAAAMFHSIINNHPFLDGNKRTSLFSAVLFLKYNGWSVEFRRKEAVKFTRRAHNQDYTVEQISKWLKEHSVKVPTGL